MVYLVLRQRHIKEAIHLEDQLERAKNARLAAARAQFASDRESDREKLLDSFDQVRQLIFIK